MAQEEERGCAILCVPELKIEPTMTVENLGGGARTLVDGQVEPSDADLVFELILALEVPTEIPRVGVTLEAIFVPFGDTSVHPFTETSAAAAPAASPSAIMASSSRPSSILNCSTRIRAVGGCRPTSTS